MTFRNLFVTKLPRNLTDMDLEKIFMEYKPTSTKIMLDAATGKSKGFGFVLFESEESGINAHNVLNGKCVRAGGHSFNLCIYPSKHDGKVAMEVSNALYIRNIPRNLSQYDVEQFLSSFGNLTYCAMREDHYGSPVWVVYAEYDTVDEAKNALSKLHGNNTYFDYPAAVLAKFEDSDDARRERRRRREGTGYMHSIPSSGVIFPPPRQSLSLGDATDGLSSVISFSPINFMKPTAGSTDNSVPQKSFTYSSLEDVFTHTTVSSDISHTPPPPPPYHYAQAQNFSFFSQNEENAIKLMRYSLSHPLQHPPGYCVAFSENGQPIFSQSSPVDPNNGGISFPPLSVSFQISNAAQTSGFEGGDTQEHSLMNSQARGTMMLVNGGQEYVLTPDAVNVRAANAPNPLYEAVSSMSFSPY